MESDLVGVGWDGERVEGDPGSTAMEDALQERTEVSDMPLMSK